MTDLQTRLAKFPKFIAAAVSGVEGIVVIEVGVQGYKRFEKASTLAAADELIAAAFDCRVPNEYERQAAVFASMFGWETPGADPDVWEEAARNPHGETLGADPDVW